jgi:hypothetical protein
LRLNVPNKMRHSDVSMAIQLSDLRQKMITPTPAQTIAEGTLSKSRYTAYEPLEIPAASRLARTVPGARSGSSKLMSE